MRAFPYRLTVIGFALGAAALGFYLYLVWSGEPSHTPPGSLAAIQPSPAVASSPASLLPTLQPQQPQHPDRIQPPPAPDLTSVFPPQQMPVVATARGASVSLHYLAQNGADLSKPMPSKHHVFAATQQIASQLAEWGRANGFEIRGPVMFPDHVGTPRFQLDLVRTEVPDPAHIEAEGRMILATVQKTPGSYYQTWSGEIVR